MGDLKNFPEIAGLTKDEIGALISLHIQYASRIDLIRQDFETLFKRKLTVKTIRQVGEKYADKIVEKVKELAEEGKLNPLSTRNNRYRFLYLLFRESMQYKTREWIRLNKDKAIRKKSRDVRTAIHCIELAHKMDLDWERVALAKARVGEHSDIDEDVPEADFDESDLGWGS